MDIQMISFVLAIVLGLVCFGLVKHTADEFDRWYDDTLPARLRIPAIAGTLATFGLIALFIFAH